MKVRRFLAVAGALAATGLLSSAPAMAAGTRVSVRVEGLTHTLLRQTTVTTPTHGSITKGRAPKNSCPATSAAGALNVATRGRWNGSYSAQYSELSVTSVFGENHPLTKTSKYYWSLWVNDKYASAGICQLTLRRGDQLLLAAVPDTGSPSPIVLSIPRTARVGHAFRARALYQGAKGRTPLAGAVVSIGAKHGSTNKQGYITLKATRPGHYQINVTRAGYIRDEAAITVTR